MSISQRARSSTRAATIHFACSLVVAALMGALVLLLWFPHPYDILSGGRELFLLLVGVDVVCGPLLTLLLWNPAKPRRELLTDMALVVLIQLSALLYGLNTAYVARPLFLVHEIDRFRVITKGDYNGIDVSAVLTKMNASLRPRWFKGPVTVGIREPRDAQERTTVLMESVMGGRDFSQRPEFYVPYDTAYQAKALARTKPLKAFIDRYPTVIDDASALLSAHGVAMEDALFLPVIHRGDWVAVLSKTARILGFLPGDGFDVRP